MSDCQRRETVSHVGNFCSGDEVVTSGEVIMPARFRQFYGRHLRIGFKEVRFQTTKNEIKCFTENEILKCYLVTNL